MTHRHACGLTLYLALCAGCIASANVWAANPEPYATWNFQYPGTHTLVWYYDTRQDYLKNEPNRAVVDDVEFAVTPGVSPPSENSIYLLEYSHVNQGEDVLDIGTGTGLHAIFAAKKAKRIVATDIAPAAIANARFNVQRLGLESKIDLRVGDLFQPLKPGEKFDVIYFNINFPFSTDPSARNALHERLFSEVRPHMKPGARIYYQTSFIKNFPRIYDMLQRHHMRIMEMHMAHLTQYRHEPVIMMIQAGAPER